MPKAARVLATLKRDGRVGVRRSGSHRTLQKGSQVVTWAFHGTDLGGKQMAQIARQVGYSLQELRRL